MADPNCPACQGPMALRVRQRDGHRFFGCMSFPQCRGTISESEVNPQPRHRSPTPLRLPRQSDAMDDLDNAISRTLSGDEWVDRETGEWTDY